MNPSTTIWLRVRLRAFELHCDRSGLAAVEFAMIVPLMLVLFFGVYELSSGVAVNRKVTLMARTLSDLTSQNTTVTDAQLTNFFNASKAILTPYASAPVNATISELYVDPSTKEARVQWSKGAAARATGTPVAIPAALKVGDTYLIFSEVSYSYIPGTAWFIEKGGIELKDSTYTRPRQSKCVDYPPPLTPGAACTPK
jgi:Flp pilus assembly protein TadG